MQVRLVTNAQDTYFEQVSLPFGTALNAESTGAGNRRLTSYDRSAPPASTTPSPPPQQERFTQVDTIGMGAASAGDPQSLNMLTAELQNWGDQLRQAYYLGQSQGIATASYMGRQLFKSQEYANRGRDNHWFVYDLYWAYLQRAPDPGGWSFWEGQLNSGATRDAVRVGGFEQSAEFAAKVATCAREGRAPPH